MTTYDGRLKGVRDEDLFFWDGAGDTWTYGATIGSTVSSVSDIIDLGADQVFINHPAVVMFEALAAFSCLSVHSVSLLADKIGLAGVWLQEASDGSTFVDIRFIKFTDNASLAVTAAEFSEATLGVVKCKRYLRLHQKCGFVGGTTFRAWLRLGLTA